MKLKCRNLNTLQDKKVIQIICSNLKIFWSAHQQKNDPLLCLTVEEWWLMLKKMKNYKKILGK